MVDTCRLCVGWSDCEDTYNSYNDSWPIHHEQLYSTSTSVFTSLNPIIRKFALIQKSGYFTLWTQSWRVFNSDLNVYLLTPLDTSAFNVFIYMIVYLYTFLRCLALSIAFAAFNVTKRRYVHCPNDQADNCEFDCPFECCDNTTHTTAQLKNT